jgi:hypothetical protein
LIQPPWAQPAQYDVPAARDLLAKRIIEAALENGERDPQGLKAFAMAGLKRPGNQG